MYGNLIEKARKKSLHKPVKTLQMHKITLTFAVVTLTFDKLKKLDFTGG